MPTHTPDSVVVVRAFTRQPDGNEIIIGVAETGVFLAVPPEAVELLDYLAQGKSIGEVAEIYQQKYSEALDIDDFMDLMEAKGIVAPPDKNGNHVQASNATPQQAVRVRYHFSNFPQSLARIIFSRPTLMGGFLLIALAVASMVRDPSLVPRPSDFFFPNHRALSVLVFSLIAWATIFLHELGHLVAARAVGINSRMGISHRLWFVVAEADVTGLWAIPKQQRYLPLFAGMLIDMVSAAVLVLLLFACDQKWVEFPSVAVRIARAMVLSYWLRIIWQFFVFVRTDLYFVIVSFFNCKNLLKDTEGFLRNLVARVIPWVRPVDQSAIPNSEWRIIRGYSVLWVAGRIMALFILFSVTLPVAFSYVRNLRDALKAGYSANPYDFIDSFVLSAAFLIPLTVGFILWIIGMLRSERT